MALLSIFVFGAALAISAWTIWATIAPRFGRILDLLVHGPVIVPALPVPVPARTGLRTVRVRPVPPAPQRAAA